MGFLSGMKASINAWFDRQQAELDKKKAEQAAHKKLMDQIAAESALGASGRLEREFQRYKNGEIDLEEYREQIATEQQENKEALDLLKDDRRNMDADAYEAERDQLDEDRDEIRWRLEWANKQIRAQAARPEGMPSRGKWIQFEIVDKNGEVTRNHLVNWETDQKRLYGYNRKKKEEEAFNLDQINEWTCG